MPPRSSRPTGTPVVTSQDTRGVDDREPVARRPFGGRPRDLCVGGQPVGRVDDEATDAVGIDVAGSERALSVALRGVEALPVSGAHAAVAASYPYVDSLGLGDNRLDGRDRLRGGPTGRRVGRESLVAGLVVGDGRAPGVGQEFGIRANHPSASHATGSARSVAGASVLLE